ncbi:hypothetical protein [Stenotrophomonas nematodicola]|uniref:hypothetical protein n=1 Tax=Stenotrophomonas nematodicola TaxID=2656746 RepID=UPI003D9A3427
MLSRVAHRLRLRCAAKALLLLSMLASGLLAPLAAQAQIIPTWREEYDKRLKYGDLVEPLKGEIFGEKINLYDGSVSFSATDISLPGSNGLDVSISRSYGDIAGSRGDKEFGTWTLDVPSLSGIHGDQPETVSEGYWSPRALFDGNCAADAGSLELSAHADDQLRPAHLLGWGASYTAWWQR